MIHAHHDLKRYQPGACYACQTTVHLSGLPRGGASRVLRTVSKTLWDEAPRVVVADPERGPQLALGDGQLGLGISGFFMANVDFTTPEALELRKKGYDLARPGSMTSASV